MFQVRVPNPPAWKLAVNLEGGASTNETLWCAQSMVCGRARASEEPIRGKAQLRLESLPVLKRTHTHTKEKHHRTACNNSTCWAERNKEGTPNRKLTHTTGEWLSLTMLKWFQGAPKETPTIPNGSLVDSSLHRSELDFYTSKHHPARRKYTLRRIRWQTLATKKIHVE